MGGRQIEWYSHGPESGPCCDVEYLLYLLLVQWSEIQLSVRLQHQSMVPFRLLDCTIEAVTIDRGCEVLAFGGCRNKTRECVLRQQPKATSSRPWLLRHAGSYKISMDST